VAAAAWATAAFLARMSSEIKFFKKILRKEKIDGIKILCSVVIISDKVCLLWIHTSNASLGPLKIYPEIFPSWTVSHLLVPCTASYSPFCFYWEHFQRSCPNAQHPNLQGKSSTLVPEASAPLLTMVPKKKKHPFISSRELSDIFIVI